MKKMFAVLMLIVVMSMCPMLQAFDGPSPQEILGQLPAEKAILFQQTMKEVWEATANIREQIKGLEAEMKSVLTASEFDEALFLEKAKSLRELHDTEREVMDEVIAKLASQFTTEERVILAELIIRRPMPPWPSANTLKSIDQRSMLGRMIFMFPPKYQYFIRGDQDLRK